MRVLFLLFLLPSLFACSSSDPVAYGDKEEIPRPRAFKTSSQLGSCKLLLYTTSDDDPEFGAEVAYLGVGKDRSPYYLQWWTRTKSWADTVESNELSTPVKGVCIGDTVTVRAINRSGDTAVVEGIL